MAYLKTKAIVISKKAYKENDLLVTVLSQTSGKISFVAKGANLVTSSRLGSLQLGNTLSLELYLRNDFYWLNELSVDKSFIKDSLSLNQMKLFFYFLELLNFLIADFQDASLIYLVCSKALDAISKNSLSKFVSYQIELSTQLGFGVPTSINQSFVQKKYLVCQNLLINHFESILEKPLLTVKL